VLTCNRLTIVLGYPDSSKNNKVIKKAFSPLPDNTDHICTISWFMLNIGDIWVLKNFPLICQNCYWWYGTRMVSKMAMGIINISKYLGNNKCNVPQTPLYWSQSDGVPQKQWVTLLMHFNVELMQTVEHQS